MKACRHHPHIKIATIDEAIAQHEENSSYVDTNTILFGGYSRKKTFNQTNNSLENFDLIEDTQGPSLGIKKKFSWGSQFEISLQDLTIETTSRNALYPRRRQSAFLVKFDTPLLKGGGDHVVNNKYYKAHFKHQQAKARLYKLFNQALKDCTLALINFEQAKKELASKNRDYQTSEEIFEFDKMKFKLGQKSEMDFLASQAALTSKKAALLNAEVNFEKQKSEILFGLHLDNESKIPEIDWKDILNFEVPKIKNKNYPELIELLHENSVQETDLWMAQDGIRPQLGLKLEVLSVGLALDRAETHRQVKNYEFPAFEISLNYVQPWDFKRAKEELNIQNLKSNQFKMRKNKLMSDLKIRDQSYASDYSSFRSLIDQEEALFRKEELLFQKTKKMYLLGQVPRNYVEDAQVNYENKFIDLHSAKYKYLENKLELLSMRGDLILIK